MTLSTNSMPAGHVGYRRDRATFRIRKAALPREQLVIFALNAHPAILTRGRVLNARASTAGAKLEYPDRRGTGAAFSEGHHRRNVSDGRIEVCIPMSLALVVLKFTIWLTVPRAVGMVCLN